MEIQMAPPLKIIFTVKVTMCKEKIQILEEAICIEEEVVERILIKHGCNVRTENFGDYSYECWHGSNSNRKGKEDYEGHCNTHSI